MLPFSGVIRIHESVPGMVYGLGLFPLSKPRHVRLVGDTKNRLPADSLVASSRPGRLLRCGTEAEKSDFGFGIKG